MKDVVGVPFEVGQVITYPGRYSSTLFVNTGIVREVLEDTLKVERFEVQFIYDAEGGNHHYEVVSKLVVVQVPGRATVATVGSIKFRASLQVEALRQTKAWHERTHR